MEKTEIGLSVESLQCALYALNGGANTIYPEIKSFSEKTENVNFSFEDLRKLKTECSKRQKRLFITLNTLVEDSDIPEIMDFLKKLEYLQPDGVVIQDLGVSKLIREFFPSLKMYASTRLAVHTSEGVRAMKELGFAGVVLAKELSFDQIKEIRGQCPDVELKVFIHGDMCYSFSGLCTDKDNNCRNCSKICRTRFSCQETNLESWFFSMKDLSLGLRIKDLVGIGIDSLLIDGIEKGPEYNYYCARYYRLLADGADESSIEVEDTRKSLKTAFERESGAGFFNTGNKGSEDCQGLVSSTFPFHRGLLVGTVDKVLKGKAVVKFSEPVALRDGLLVIFNSQSSCFTLKEIDGKKSFVSKNETATVNFPDSEFQKKPVFGTPVYCISRQNNNPGETNENIPLYKKPVDLTVEITDNSVILNGEEYPTEVMQAKTQGNIESVIKQVFSSSDRSLFTLGNLAFKNNSGLNSVFIPLSELKQIRRTYYEKIDWAFERFTVKPNVAAFTTADGDLPENRSSLGLFDKIVKIKNTEYLPLSPLLFNESEFFSKLENILRDHPKIILGLNNIAQVHWAEKHRDVEVFADIFLHTENLCSYALLKQTIPNLVGSYELSPNTPFTYSGSSFKAPLFYSLVCFRHNSLELSCSGCNRNNTYHLVRNSKHYTVRCKDCLTTVTED